MFVTSINPWNLEEVGRFTCHTNEEADAIIESVHERYLLWKHTSFAERSALFIRAAEVLNERKREFADHITAEMGKPITEAVAEVEKCAWACRFYAETAEMHLAPRTVETDATKSFVRHDPLGVIYAIMPWNFPFWQVLRFAAPTLMAGNTAVLKHAPNVSRCALDIEEVFRAAGFPENCFRTLILDNSQAARIIEHPRVRAVSLTGSEKAGEAVASTAGRVLKPSVLELGGSNAVIVLEDADLEKAVDVGFRARFLNSGQSCIAGKRFLVHEALYDRYVDMMTDKVKGLIFKDPTDPSTRIGPLARVDLAQGIERQVNESIAKGAKLKLGGQREGAKYDATILTDVHPGMPAFDEELFGPVAPFVKVRDFDEAIQLSNQSPFGLGVTVCTSNPERVLERIHEFEEGAVFINELVKSDPRLPFGGIKRSGFGRELGTEGILEFVNTKTVYVK